jgi:hypothetical protein
MLLLLQVLDVKLPFDEAQLLRDNLPYLLRSLNLEGLTVSSAAAADAPAAAKAAGPGQPHFQFTAGAPAAAAAAAVPEMAMAS